MGDSEHNSHSTRPGRPPTTPETPHNTVQNADHSTSELPPQVQQAAPTTTHPNRSPATGASTAVPPMPDRSRAPSSAAGQALAAGVRSTSPPRVLHTPAGVRHNWEQNLPGLVPQWRHRLIDIHSNVPTEVFVKSLTAKQISGGARMARRMEPEELLRFWKSMVARHKLPRVSKVKRVGIFKKMLWTYICAPCRRNGRTSCDYADQVILAIASGIEVGNVVCGNCYAEHGDCLKCQDDWHNDFPYLNIEAPVLSTEEITRGITSVMAAYRDRVERGDERRRTATRGWSNTANETYTPSLYPSFPPPSYSSLLQQMRELQQMLELQQVRDLQQVRELQQMRELQDLRTQLLEKQLSDMEEQVRRGRDRSRSPRRGHGQHYRDREHARREIGKSPPSYRLRDEQDGRYDQHGGLSFPQRQPSARSAVPPPVRPARPPPTRPVVPLPPSARQSPASLRQGSGHGQGLQLQQQHRPSYGGPQIGHAQQPSVHQVGNSHVTAPRPISNGSRVRTGPGPVTTRPGPSHSEQAMSRLQAPPSSGKTGDGVAAATSRAARGRAPVPPQPSSRAPIRAIERNDHGLHTSTHATPPESVARQSSRPPGRVQNGSNGSLSASAPALSRASLARSAHTSTAPSPRPQQANTSIRSVNTKIPPGEAPVEPSHSATGPTPTLTTDYSYNQAAFQQQVSDLINGIEKQVRRDRNRSRSPRSGRETRYHERENDQLLQSLPRGHQAEPYGQSDRYRGPSIIPPGHRTDLSRSRPPPARPAYPPPPSSRLPPAGSELPQPAAPGQPTAPLRYQPSSSRVRSPRSRSSRTPRPGDRSSDRC